MISITRPKWVAIALVIVGAGLIFVGTWFGAEAALFAVDGSTATGTVIDKRVEPNHFSSTNPSSTRDPNGYFVSVDFTPEGGSERRTELLVDREVWDGLTIGQSVAVSYVRALPGLNTLADQSGGWSAGPLVVGLLALGVSVGFVGMGGWILVSDRRRAALAKRLSAVGVPTTGTVVDNDAGELRIGGNMRRQLRYRFTDSEGREHTGLSDWMPRRDALAWAADATGLVRYDPDRPELSAWFGDADPPG